MKHYLDGTGGIGLGLALDGDGGDGLGSDAIGSAGRSSYMNKFKYYKRKTKGILMNKTYRLWVCISKLTDSFCSSRIRILIF